MNVKTFEEVRQRFLEITFEERFDLIVAVANGGIIPAAIGRGPGKNRNNLELCPTVVARCGGCCSEDFCCQWECRLLPV